MEPLHSTVQENSSVWVNKKSANLQSYSKVYSIVLRVNRIFEMTNKFQKLSTAPLKSHYCIENICRSVYIVQHSPIYRPYSPRRLLLTRWKFHFQSWNVCLSPMIMPTFPPAPRVVCAICKRWKFVLTALHTLYEQPGDGIKARTSRQQAGNPHGNKNQVFCTKNNQK